MQTHTNHKKVLAIALPAGANALLDTLQIIVDLLMVGRLSTYAIAAVGLGLQAIMIFFALLGLFGIGTTVLIARYVGRGSMRRASFALSSMLRFGLWSALPVAGLWYLLTPWLYVWFDMAQQVTILGLDYVLVLTWMMPFVIFKFIFVAALNAYGDTKTPLYIKLVSIALNIALNYLFIFGYGAIPPMGVMGAAIATVIVNILEAIFYLYLYIRHKTPFVPLWSYSWQLAEKMIKIGLPASIERTLLMSSYAVFGLIIASYGTYAFSGYQLGLRIEGLAYMPGLGFTIAAMTLVGQALGAKNPNRAKADTLLVLRYTMALMGVVSIFMVSIPHQLASLFSDHEATIEQASIYLIIVGLSQFPLAMELVLSGALRGAGDTKTPLIINLVSFWLVRIIPAFTLSYYFDTVIVVYLAMIADTTLKAIILWIVFKQEKWQKIKI